MSTPGSSEGVALPREIGKPATRALERVGITTLEKLASMSERELLGLHGVGPKAVRLLKLALAERGLQLTTPPDLPQ